jgi:mannan endo-1,4-beta-mannosidase
MKHILAIAVALFAFPSVWAQLKTPVLTDSKATEETKYLFSNLYLLASDNKLLFGHQHATEYGHGWSGDDNRSDVKSVTGTHPAVIGVDFMDAFGMEGKDIGKKREALRKNIATTYDRGGITTVSWHFNNPAFAGGFYWKDSVSKPSVKLIIPGGSHHEVYKKLLADMASFARSVKGKDNKIVPMIFRPYHEFDGDWFWWGRSHCTVDEFKTLWRFTVTYLRDSMQVHNFIYAFSPDNRFNTEAEFTERYPGNGYVDMVGMDNYGDWGRDGKYDLEAGIKKLQIVSAFAEKNGKLAAFTETGLESIPNTAWWTETLLRSILAAKVKLAYVLVWRNDITSPTHYYAPFPGQVSEKDFLQFYQHPVTLFENDLPKMYEQPMVKN